MFYFEWRFEMPKTPRELLESIIVYGKKGSKNYSPLNIRAIILSPDGALVFFHESSLTGSYLRHCEWSCDELQPDGKQYRPLLTLLNSPACSAIEEIFVIPVSNLGVNMQDWAMAELNFKSNITFRRLRGRFLLNLSYSIIKNHCEQNIRTQEFRKAMQSGEYLISDMFGLKKQIQPITSINEDWNTSWQNNFDYDKYPCNHQLIDRFNKLAKKSNNLVAELEDYYKHINGVIEFYVYIGHVYIECKKGSILQGYLKPLPPVRELQGRIGGIEDIIGMSGKYRYIPFIQAEHRKPDARDIDKLKSASETSDKLLESMMNSVVFDGIQGIISEGISGACRGITSQGVSGACRGIIKSYLPDFNTKSDIYSLVIAGVLLYCNPRSEKFKKSYLDKEYWHKVYEKFVKGDDKSEHDR